MRTLCRDLCKKMLLKRRDAPAIQVAHQRYDEQSGADREHW